MSAPLQGLRVLDLSRLLPGGYCTLILADLGADVIKVEEPGRGDYLRDFPPASSTGESGMHLALNRGKRSITLNLRTEPGRQILRDLVVGTDVLVESFRPGVMDRLGVGYGALREVNPGLVYAAISGFGASGPYVHKAGHDIDFVAYAGALSFNGSAESGPWQPGLQIADLGGGGLMALVAILVALRVRERNGEGQFCDISMTDGVLSWLTLHAGAFAATGAPPRPGREMLNGGLACYGVYRCGDGKFLAVGALEPQFFAVLLDALGLPEELRGWQSDPARQDELRARLAEVLGRRARDEWMAVLGDLDACVAPVNDLAEAFADPSARSREMVVDRTLPDGRCFPVVGVVPRLTATPGRIGNWPSPLGADTAEVLATIGRTAEDVEALRAAGVL